MLTQQLHLLLLSLGAGALLGALFCLYEGLPGRKRWPQDLLWWWLSALPLLWLWLLLWRGSFRTQVYLWLAVGFAVVAGRFYAPLAALSRRICTRCRRPKAARSRRFFNRQVEKSRQNADIVADKLLSSTCSIGGSLKAAARRRLAGILKKNKDEKI